MTLQDMWEAIRDQATMNMECARDGGDINSVAMLMTRNGDLLIYQADGPADLDSAMLKLAEYCVDAQ